MLQLLHVIIVRHLKSSHHFLDKHQSFFISESYQLPSPYRFKAVDFPANDFPTTIIFNPNAGNNGGGILS